MKKWSFLLAVLVLIAFFSFNKKDTKEEFTKQYTKEEIYESFQDKILNISSYECIAEVCVSGNKTPTNYSFKHTYKKPDSYKVEVLSPESVKGKVIEFNSNKLTINNPNVEDKIVFEDYQNKFLFIGNFIANYSYDSAIIDEDDKFLKITKDMPNDYFNKQILYVNKKTKLPQKMQIIDINGNTRFDIIYKDFKTL